MTKPRYTIYAIRYGQAELPTSTCFSGWPEDGTFQKLAFCFWVLLGADGTVVVVDTGFNSAVAADRNRKARLSPADALRLLEIDPAKVKDVILTHLHYDHAGNTDLFPNAVFHLQKEELAFATGPRMADPALSHHYAVADLGRVVQLAHAGRINFLDGEAKILPGIAARKVKGHTDGLQCLKIETAGGPMLLSSDSVHFYAELREGRPFSVATDPAQKAASHKMLKEWVGDELRILPAHDPEVFRFYSTLERNPDIAIINGPTAIPLSSAAPTQFPRLKDQ